jgi:FkbM family methyltransferase
MNNPIPVLARNVPNFIRRMVHGNRRIDRAARKAYSFLLRVSDKTVIVESGPMAGLKGAASGYTGHSYISGNYEIETQLAIKRILHPGMVCYDLGASIGYMTLLMSRLARRVYAFELAPHAAAEIKENLDANGFTNVTIVPDPVSDTIHDVEFALTDNAYGSCIARDDKWPTIRLRTNTLDHFAASHEFPDFVKIEVEHEEICVRRGSVEVLKRRPIICCEIHSIECARGVNDILKFNNYKITTLRGIPFEIPSEITEGELQILGLPQ